jgi:2-polyprenyl-6-methoxyphenol hydroxylase-like FAD-dependent oxidoreductase
MRIVIAGGGIGGLAAALSLHAAGFTDIRVVEASPTIGVAGVGLNVLPNAVRELAELGLYRELAENAVATTELRFFSRQGKLIWQEPRGLAAGYRWPQLSVHHGYLQTVLARAVRSRLGPGSIVADAQVVSCSPLPDRAVEVAVGRAGRMETERADLLIGADGIRSAVRASHYPAEGPPPGNGMVMWRGTTWAEPFLTGRSMIVAGTDTHRIVLYPIAENPEGTRSLINWVAARPGDPAGGRHWQEKATVADVLDHFGDWRFDWLDIPAVFAAATHVYRYPLVDRDPLPRWTFGAVTLLGDAAHAMYPMGSNGATQAIVDARVLAKALAAEPDVPAALARYESERRPATTELQTSNRRHGPEEVISIVHRRSPGGFDDVREVISDGELAAISANYARTAGFDVEHVNTRPSLDARVSP